MGHGSRERDGRVWVRESNRAPRVHVQAYIIRRCADDWAMVAGLVTDTYTRLLTNDTAK